MPHRRQAFHDPLPIAVPRFGVDADAPTRAEMGFSMNAS